MSRDRYTYRYAPSHSRTLTQRAVVVGLALLGIVLLLLARGEHPAMTKLRAGLLDVVNPALSVASKPVAGIRGVVTEKQALFHAFEENKKLREENDVLRRWQSVAQALKAENDSLRMLAGYHPVGQASYVTARVIGQSPGGYSASLTINTGRSEGLKMLQPVIDSYGLVGRVTDVGETTARVLLLSDPASRVPVISGTSRHHAILMGEGEALLRMTFLGTDAESIALGEPVVTTEEGGLIPGGILIGTVFRRDANGLLVKPTRPLAQSEYLQVVVTK